MGSTSPGLGFPVLKPVSEFMEKECDVKFVCAVVILYKIVLGFYFRVLFSGLLLFLLLFIF